MLTGRTYPTNKAKGWILFLHGFMGSGDDGAPISGALNRMGFNVLAPDIPGHSLAASRETIMSTRAMTAALQGSDPFTFRGIVRIAAQLGQNYGGFYAGCGYSLGGRILTAAGLAPGGDYIQRLILLGVNPGLDTADQRRERRVRDRRQAMKLLTSWPLLFLDEWHRQPVFASLQDFRHAELLEGMIRRKRLHQREGLYRALMGYSLGRQRNLWPRLLADRRPILYLAGALDAKFCKIGQRLAERDEVYFHQIAGAGHALLDEDPQAVGTRLEQFLGAPGR